MVLPAAGTGDVINFYDAGRTIEFGGTPVANKFRVSQRVDGLGKFAFVISVGIGGHTTGTIGPLYSKKRRLESE